jgi:hypothetical protein
VTAHVRVCALAYYDERTPEPWLTTNRVAYAVSTHPFPTLDMGPEHRADVARKLVDQAVEELQDWMQANTTFGPPDPGNIRVTIRAEEARDGYLLEIAAASAGYRAEFLR